jgi:hypothetical protein
LKARCKTEGSKGRAVNLSASLSRRISSANRAHRKRWEDLMFRVTGQHTEYNDFSREERDVMAKGAKPIADRKTKINNPELVKADIATKTELSTLERQEKDALIYSRPDLLPQNYIASTARGRHDLKRIRQKEQRNLYTLEDEKEDTLEHLAQARRRAQLIRQYEIDNPDDPRVAAKRQQKLEQTPGTMEFMRKRARNLEMFDMKRKTDLEWAYRNKRNPLAKEIIRRERRRTTGGKILDKAMATSRHIIVGTILTSIMASVGAAVKFLSNIPSLLGHVRDIATKGATLGVTDEHLRKLEDWEKRLPGLKEGSVSGYLGALHTRLSDAATGGDVAGILEKFAPLLSKNDDTELAKRIVLYSVGQYTDTNALGLDLLNSILTVSMRGRTLYGDNYQPSYALRANAVTFGRGTGSSDLVYSMATAYANKNLVPATVAQQIRNVANGKDEKINGQKVGAGRTLEAFIAAIDGKSDTLKARDTATVVEWKAAEDVAAQWKNLATTFGQIKTGVLTIIVSNLSAILSFVEGIAKAVLTNPIFGNRFHDMVQGLDERSYYRNVERIKELDTVNIISKQRALSLGEQFGYKTESDVARSAEKYLSGEGVPAKFVDNVEEYIRYLIAVGSWFNAENNLNKGNAMLEGFNNMGAEITYNHRDELGRIQTKKYKYEIGNMVDLADATVNLNATKARNTMLNASITQTGWADNLNKDSWWYKIVNAFDRWYFGALENRIKSGANVSPADYSLLEKYRNSKALSERLANDGMQMGTPRPEGQQDRYVQGEAGVMAAQSARASQTELAQYNTILHEIRSQLGDKDFYGVLENKIEVSGTIRAENKTITVVLTDKATGREIGRAVDVPNMSTSNIHVGVDVESFLQSRSSAE